MKHTIYIICEPEMDRPCIQSSEPSEHQKARNEEKGGTIYKREIDLPDFHLVNGIIERA